LSKPGYYNDNRNRAYPFIERTAGVDTPATGPLRMVQLPNDWIVDCGFTIGADIGYDPTVSKLYLARVYRQQDRLYFQFAVGGEAALTFVRELDLEGYGIEYLDWSGPADGSQSQDIPDLCLATPVTGFLVTGPLTKAEVDKYLADGDEIVQDTPLAAIVEPALVQSQYRTRLLSIKLANDDRTRYESPMGCDPVEWSYPVGPGVLHIQPGCLYGPLRLRPGFNSLIQQDPDHNSLTLGARKNAGEGEVCGQIQLSDQDLPPVGHEDGALDGALRCNETIRTINGRGGPRLTILPGPGVNVLSYSADHAIHVDVNLNELTTCYQSGSQDSQE
jgi:hypothetical protein